MTIHHFDLLEQMVHERLIVGNPLIDPGIHSFKPSVGDASGGSRVNEPWMVSHKPQAPYMQSCIRLKPLMPQC